MTLEFWFANTNADETKLTTDLLAEACAANVKVSPVIEAGSPADYNQFTGRLYVDCKEDILNALRVMLFYNDYTTAGTDAIIAATSTAIEATHAAVAL
jgi:hypothetical protein